MSHRRHQKPGKNEESVSFDGILKGGWDVANMMLGLQGAARKFKQESGHSSRDFFKILESLDESGTILKKMDRKAIESLRPDQVSPFIDFYTSACITRLAKTGRADEIIQETNLAAFQNPMKGRQPPMFEDHPELIPLLTPIRDEYPYFSNLFLGAFQSRLENLLAKASLLPSSKIVGLKVDPQKGYFGDVEQIIDLKRRSDGVVKHISPRLMMDETRKAILDFLDLGFGPKKGDLFDNIANLTAAFVFMWLIATGIVDEIMDGLLTGRPVLRRVSEDGMVGYEATEYGYDIPASFLTDEEK